jgi:hypothetical protein
MKKYSFLFVFFFILSFIGNQVVTATGFIPGQIWYSKNSFIEGETVKIYTAVWNSNKNQLSARVEFYDKNVILGSRDVVVSSEQLSEVSIPWKVTAGDHIIFAKIISSVLTSDGKKESIELDSSITVEDRMFIPVVIKKEDGSQASNSDIIQSQVDKVGGTIINVLPQSISTPIGEAVGVVDGFRESALDNILTSKNNTEKDIEVYKATLNNSNDVQEIDNLNEPLKEVDEKNEKPNPLDEPIAHVKLFFLKVLEFIFVHKLIFYGLIIFIIFYIFRFIYYQIKNF